MSYPGEYPQPMLRRTLVNVPVISGYVTARLQAVDPVPPIISGDDTMMMVLFENVGLNTCGVKLQQMTDTSISGVRSEVIAPITLVPGGRRTVATSASVMPYLELYCSSGGPSQIRMQIDSQRRWGQMGFDKANDATFYPPQLWRAKPVPLATNYP